MSSTGDPEQLKAREGTFGKCFVERSEGAIIEVDPNDRMLCALYPSDAADRRVTIICGFQRIETTKDALKEFAKHLNVAEFLK